MKAAAWGAQSAPNKTPGRTFRRSSVDFEPTHSRSAPEVRRKIGTLGSRIVYLPWQKPARCWPPVPHTARIDPRQTFHNDS
jgi:hypothetical protein